MGLITMNMQQFTERIRVRLGNGQIRVNLTEDDIYETIQDALEFFTRYHHDGTQDAVYHLDMTDKEQTLFILPDYVQNVLSYFKQNQFNTPALQRLVLTELNIMYESSNLINFAAFKDYIKTVEKVLMPQYDFDFNTTTRQIQFLNRPYEDPQIFLHVLLNQTGSNLSQVLDNRWLLRYATELARRKWADVLGKTTKATLNGVRFNFQEMWNNADERIMKLEDELKDELMTPPLFFVD